METPKITIKKVSDNPFYGMRNCLVLFNNGGKAAISESLLAQCLAECITREQKQMFYSLLFSIGDITARKHNIFKTTVDSGGNAARDNFRLIMNWLKKVSYLQFAKFMFARLFNEFTSFDNLLAMRIKTRAKSKQILEKIDMTSGNPDDLVKFIVGIIQHGNPFDKFLVAKFLTRPRLSKRKNHKIMLPETKIMMNNKQELIKEISDNLNFPYVVRSGYINFSGFYQWRMQFNSELESVLFSSGKIKEFDETEFKNWLDKLPSSARFRVRKRVLTKDNVEKPKWSPIGSWFLQWENFKEDKQKEVRVLEEKIRQEMGTASMAVESINTALNDDQILLKELKKEAKVTTGAINFKELFVQLITNTADTLKIQPFLDKVKLPYNNLVFVDDSGSMQGTTSGQEFTAYDFAAFMATILLMKNPDDIGRSLMGLFSNQARMFTHIEGIKNAPNNLLRTQAVKVNLPLYNPELNFTDNLYNMRAFLMAYRTGNGTNISSIPDSIHTWTGSDSAKIEQIQQFPIWTIVTDGNWNNMYSPEASMNDFMSKCQRYFGFKPFIVAIDVAQISLNADRFAGIENFLYLPPNPAQIEQLLTNFKDMDIMDVYTPLLSLYRSNRYELVRENTL